jgi:uncharacterized protein (TIGR03067 family)
MKRRTFSAVLLALLALFFTHTMTLADDLKAMEGTWKVESAEAGGKQIESADLKEIIVTIKGDNYEVLTKGERDAGTMKLDETQKPRTMDATDTEGKDVGKVLKAIYEISGDTLRVCYATEGDERPTELASREGKSWLLLTYKREKKAE